MHCTECTHGADGQLGQILLVGQGLVTRVRVRVSHLLPCMRMDSQHAKQMQSVSYLRTVRMQTARQEREQ